MRLSKEEVYRFLTLDWAADARREAVRRQDNAKFLCVECHGPDGVHTSECTILARHTPCHTIKGELVKITLKELRLLLKVEGEAEKYIQQVGRVYRETPNDSQAVVE